MKKTRNKIFITIFLILSFIIMYVFLFSFYQNYKMQKDMIERALKQMGNFNKNNRPPDKKDDDNHPNEDRRIYLGFKVYTIMLDEDGKYIDIINHFDDESNSNQIESVAREIIDNHTDDKFFGNLLYTKYVYSFTENNSLILIDASLVNSSLKNILLRTIILILGSECLIILVTYFLTKWIMKPVIDSFERQKEFIADASHELKTPLSVMLASCDMYYQDHDIKWIDNIKSESERINKLVKNLLDLSRTEQENIVLSNLNLSKIIESRILTLESLFYDKKIKLNYKIDDDIYFKCNEEQIKELVSILLDNAIKHCDKNGNVNVFLEKNNKNIIFKVENTGDAILPEEEEKIFERFYRSDDSRNRDSNRYGLGLAIAKNIVLKHNGVIKAHSERGITVFKITWNQK